MKSYAILMSAALAVCSFSGCEDFLDIKPLNDIVLENFWDEKSDVDNMISGCYSTMQSGDFVYRLMVWGEVRSDNIVAGNNVNTNVDLSNIFQENLRANNSYTKWEKFYSVINSCNLIIKYAPQVAEKSPDYTQSALKATIAEASALRDLCYFYLIRAFRDVPYTTEAYVDDNQPLALPASKFDDILDALIKDLESVQNDAVKVYPETTPLYQTGRITQDAIHAMLCEMYLWKQDYEKCIWYADTVINAKLQEYNEKYREYGGLVNGVVDKLVEGYPLISDANSTNTMYGSAYTQLFVDGNSSESIFELTYMDNDNMLSNEAVSHGYGNEETFPGFFRPADFIATDIPDHSYQVYNNMYDTRYYESLQRSTSTDFKINKYVTNGATIDLSASTSDELAVSYGTAYRASYCSANWIVYRLTDIMLMKAEALVQLAIDKENGKDPKLSEAFKLVNAVNLRSNCDKNKVAVLDSTLYTTKSTMDNLVMAERQRELMFEGKRWFDLVRRARRESNTDYLVEQVKRKYTTNGSAVQSKLSKMEAIYWPYNEDELKVNLYLEQNPAFASGESSSFE